VNWVERCNDADGYPYLPNKPEFVQDVEKLQTNLREYVDPGTRADPEKKALFGAAKEVRDLSIHIGVRCSICFSSTWRKG
jgi:hypothetical protein